MMLLIDDAVDAKAAATAWEAVGARLSQAARLGLGFFALPGWRLLVVAAPGPRRPKRPGLRWRRSQSNNLSINRIKR